MRQTILFAFLILSAKTAFASELATQMTISQCKVVDQGWSFENYYCQTHGYPADTNFRCYAIIDVNGQRTRIWGSGCYATANECSFGSGRVDPCD